MHKIRGPIFRKLSVWFVIGLLWLLIHNWLATQTGAVKKLTLVGQIQITSSQQGLSSSGYLPLLAFEPNTLKEPTPPLILADVFFEPDDIQPPQHNSDSQVNYRDMLKLKINVQSISKQGAIINNRYVEKGEVIPGVMLKLSTESVAAVRLTDVDTTSDQITVNINNESFVF